MATFKFLSYLKFCKKYLGFKYPVNMNELNLFDILKLYLIWIVLKIKPEFILIGLFWKCIVMFC